jgi:glycosyltransferase involved in cell wall biosynthesis
MTMLRRARGRVVAGLFFFPRGGSAFVARALCRALAGTGWDVTLVSGSLGAPSSAGSASTFFEGLDVRPVEYGLGGGSVVPPSYEEEAQLAFPAVDDAGFERLVELWTDALTDAGAAYADLLHLHHLTPAHEAALRSFPHVPVVAHLHGTELAMLRAIEAGPSAAWPHARRWRERLRRWAGSSARIVALPALASEAAALLGVRGDQIVRLPNGVDRRLFVQRPLPVAERLAFWRRWLVEDPRGWCESGAPGSVAYRAGDLEPFRDAAAVLLYVGRFLAVKRVPLLIRAYRRAQERFMRRAPLVLVGGYPGEVEGAHPLAVAREVGAEDVFLAGWRLHFELPDALNAADVLVFPSVGDSFGLPIVEAMACGVPAIAAAAGGPAQIVRDGETGWLVPPDDEAALAEAICAAVADPDERKRRGERALVESDRWAWPPIAVRLGAVYEELLLARPEQRMRRARP